MIRGRVNAPKEGQALRLRLLLPDAGAPRPSSTIAGEVVSFRATVHSQLAEIVRLRGDLNSEGQPHVEIDCPSRGLAPGDYCILLEESMAEGGFQTVAKYSFQLTEEPMPDAEAANGSDERAGTNADAEGRPA